MQKRLLITDLDNTLYDWVTYFAKSFGAMIDDVETITGLDREQLLHEFKAVHQRYANSEQPFAILELPSIQKHFGTSSGSELRYHLDSALYKFNKTRKAELRLYPTVRETIESLFARRIKIIGHTEAMLLNSFWRLQFFHLVDYFRRLYTLEGKWQPHPDPTSHLFMQSPPEGFVRIVSKSERKPNPHLLLDMCEREGVAPEEVVYVGDSLTRDVSMAKNAGIMAVWARYGNQYDRSLWQLLVQVTHWTDEDVQREEHLRVAYKDVEPDLIIDRFDDVAGLFG